MFMRFFQLLSYYNTFLYSTNYSCCFHIFTPFLYSKNVPKTQYLCGFSGFWFCEKQAPDFLCFCIKIFRDTKTQREKIAKKSVFMRVFGVFAVTTRPKSFFANLLVNLLGISITLFMEIMSLFSTNFSIILRKGMQYHYVFRCMSIIT